MYINRFSSGDFSFPPDKPNRPAPQSGADFRSTVFRARVAQLEAETSSTALMLRESSRESRVAAEHLGVIVDTLVGGRTEGGASTEVLEASKLTPGRGEPFLLLLARLKTRPPEFGRPEPADFRSAWDGPAIPPGGVELLVVSQSGEAFVHFASGNDDVFMVVRCPAAGEVDLEALDLDAWLFDFRFSESAFAAEAEALRIGLDKRTFREEPPWEPVRNFLLDEVEFAMRRDHGKSVAWGLVEVLEGRDAVEVVAFDDDRGRYELLLEWNPRTGRLSIDSPTKTCLP